MKKKISWDIIDLNKVNYLKNIIQPKLLLTNSKVLPYGGHWVHFNENYKNSELGIDGHLKRGGFFPLLNGYKRMFGGSKLYFKKDIFFEDKIKKIMIIDKKNKKISNENSLYFFEVINIFLRSRVEVLREIQTIIFLKERKKSVKKINKKNKKLKNVLIKKIFFNYSNIDLFKYSAISFNTHRIHYDLKYAMEHEGHKNLLVHGPLIATTVLNEVIKETKRKLSEFNFSVLNPIYVNDRVLMKIYDSELSDTDLLIKVFKKNAELAFKAYARFAIK